MQFARPRPRPSRWRLARGAAARPCAGQRAAAARCVAPARRAFIMPAAGGGHVDVVVSFSVLSLSLSLAYARTQGRAHTYIHCHTRTHGAQGRRRAAVESCVAGEGAGERRTRRGMAAISSTSAIASVGPVASRSQPHARRSVARQRRPPAAAAVACRRKGQGMRRARSWARVDRGDLASFSLAVVPFSLALPKADGRPGPPSRRCTDAPPLFSVASLPLWFSSSFASLFFFFKTRTRGPAHDQQGSGIRRSLLARPVPRGLAAQPRKGGRRQQRASRSGVGIILARNRGRRRMRFIFDQSPCPRFKLSSRVAQYSPTMHGDTSVDKG